MYDMNIGILLMLLLFYLAITLAWIVTLIRQAKKKQWAWFVVSLLISPAFMVYWLLKWTKLAKIN